MTSPAGAAVPESARRPAGPLVRSFGSPVATDWTRTLYGVVMAEGLTPPAAARFYYATALAMYETAQPGMPDHRPVAGQVPGLRALPPPPDRVDWPAAIAGVVPVVALGLLPAASEASVASIDAHAETVLAARRAEVGPGVQRSVLYGERVGRRIVAWMDRDGYAEAAATPYTPPVGPDKWRSTPPNFGTAIDPHYHLVRPALLRRADEVEPAPPVPFSTEAGSPFHEQALAPYRQSFVNTDDQVAIARFWTDNPRLSGLPSGHWFLLLAQLADGDLALDLEEALEGLLRLGAALHDAFLCCWTWKYRFQLIRPVSYIHDHVDPDWVTLVNTPQFPEYTSGHSVSSGAADVVLTSLYGSFGFTDSTGVSRDLAPRSFTSFTHAAEEAAMSRLYGGIHYPMAIENGLDQGRAIGRLVDRRLRTRRR